MSFARGCTLVTFGYVYVQFWFNDKYVLMDRLPQDCRPFHPKDPVYGTLNYDIGALNKYQKKTLNLRKTSHRYENEIYLKMHPEIKGLISILLRHVLRAQPLMQIHESVGKFFNRPRYEILADLLKYRSSTE